MARSEKMQNFNEAAYFSNPSWRFSECRDSPSLVSPRNGTPKKSDICSSTFPESQLQTCPSPKSAQPEQSKRDLSTISSQSLPAENLDEGELDDYMDEAEFDLWISQQYQEETRRLSTTDGSKSGTRRKSSIIPQRNPPITHPYQSLREYFHNGIRLTPNSFVELEDEDFMKIVHIVKDSTQAEVTLRGYIFRRTREMNGLLNRLLNEVCWILHVDEDDQRDPLIQGVETRSVSEVIKRRAIRLTNRPFPALSFREDSKDTQEVVMSERVLVCRFKYLCFYANAKARMAYTWSEKGLHRLKEDECDKRNDNDVKDEDLRCVWRGETIPGGTKKGWLIGEKEFLRQEALSHRGISSYQSLRAGTGLDFPRGDIMKRFDVGAILDEEDLVSSDRVSTTSSVRCGTPNISFPRATKQEAQGELLSLTPTSRCRHEGDLQRGRSLTRKVSATKSNGHRPGNFADTLDLFPSLDRTSSQALAVRTPEPEIVEINARVKTTSSLGTFQKHYEGKVTSTYTPNLQHKNKRSGDASFDLSTRPSKKAHLQSQVMSNQPHRSSSALSNIDSKFEARLESKGKCLPRSDFEDSIEDLSLPAKVTGFRLGENGIQKSSPPGRHDAGRMRTYTDGRTSISGVTCHRRPESDHNGDNEDDVIDLSSPLATSASHFFGVFEQRSLPAASGPLVSCPRIHRSGSKALHSPNMFSGYGPASNTLNKMKNEHSAETVDRLSRGLSGYFPHSQANNESPAQAMSVPSQKKITSNNTGSPFKSKPKMQRYTFGDCFCGAGGMSRGAINAGLRIDWGFDFNLAACQSYAMNFFGTPVYNVAADQFTNGEGSRKVDICHLSPPCQFFSDAHTIQGKDDDMNTASLFAIFNLLQKTKPRVVTLEQTSGLIRRHPHFFNAVVNMFTSKGFSVRWRVRNCADYGLPQRRMRLFIIASWYVDMLSYHLDLDPLSLL